MECKHCYSENVELREARMVERIVPKTRIVKHVTVLIYDCNFCGRVSKYEMHPVDDDDDEKEYASPDENWQWCPPEA